MKRTAITLALSAMLLSACAGSSVLLAGESMRLPEPPPQMLTFVVLGADDLTPVPAAITTAAESVLTDAAGAAELLWEDKPIDVTVAAPGFYETSLTVAEKPLEGPIQVRLEPVVLSGRVISGDGRPLPGARIKLGDQLEASTDSDGEFTIFRATPGDVVVERPAWEGAVVAWDGASDEISVELEPRMIQALRVAGDGSGAGDVEKWQELLELADNTGINAFVVDTQDESGYVYHDTEVALAYEIDAVRPRYDAAQVIADMDAHGLYKITRIVTFQSDQLARARPDIAAINTQTGLPWTNNKNLAWLDPTDRDSWDYPLALAEEACRLGFDEIQFDYIRFPSDGPISQLSFDELTSDNYYSEESEQIRVSTIAAFLEEAHGRLNSMGCAVAADIFAITLESTSDEGIGQSPRVFSNYVDVLSPMIYTYTYGPGWKGWADPTDHATELVSAALDAGIPRLEGFAVYRPWLQRAFLEDYDILAVQGVAEEQHGMDVVERRDPVQRKSPSTPRVTGSRSLEDLTLEITACRRCPRLVEWRERVALEKRAAFADEEYWGKPVPGWGDPDAALVVVGLAPAAHGANRTGRMFTGDRSGDWLYRALHDAGFANQPGSRDRDDALILTNAWVTAPVRCAPPANKPTTEERDNCADWFAQELDLLTGAEVYVALGQYGYLSLWRHLARRLNDVPRPRPKFAHGGEVTLSDGRSVLMSFHPSQQNTFTGKLTVAMFADVFDRARELTAPRRQDP